jgi:hypothetical protein
MRITRRQLRKIIREEKERFLREQIDAAGLPGAISPEDWATQNKLEVDLDNEGQKIIYLTNHQADAMEFPPGVSWDAQPNKDGTTWTIYTGEY